MADLSSLPFVIRATIIDSLGDYQENYENAAEVSEGETGEYFTNRAKECDNTLEFFQHGRNLNESDVNLIVEALEASMRNCAELDLDEAYRDYSEALSAVRGAP